MSREVKPKSVAWVSVGIDPGMNGGLAVIAGSNKDDVVFCSHARMPLITSNNGRRALEPYPLIRAFKSLFTVDCDVTGDTPRFFVVIEKPPIMPKNGKIATASLFQSYGCILGIFHAMTYGIRGHVTIIQVSPQVWKAKVLPNSAKGKQPAIDFVLDNYPEACLPKLSPRSKKYHDGIADAICLAEYARLLVKESGLVAIKKQGGA